MPRTRRYKRKLNPHRELIKAQRQTILEELKRSSRQIVPSLLSPFKSKEMLIEHLAALPESLLENMPDTWDGGAQSAYYAFLSWLEWHGHEVEHDLEKGLKLFEKLAKAEMLRRKALVYDLGGKDYQPETIEAYRSLCSILEKSQISLDSFMTLKRTDRVSIWEQVWRKYSRQILNCSWNAARLYRSKRAAIQRNVHNLIKAGKVPQPKRAVTTLQKTKKRFPSKS